MDMQKVLPDLESRAVGSMWLLKRRYLAGERKKKMVPQIHGEVRAGENLGYGAGEVGGFEWSRVL